MTTQYPADGNIANLFFVFNNFMRELNAENRDKAKSSIENIAENNNFYSETDDEYKNMIELWKTLLNWLELENNRNLENENDKNNIQNKKFFEILKEFLFEPSINLSEHLKIEIFPFWYHNKRYPLGFPVSGQFYSGILCQNRIKTPRIIN